MRSGPRPLPWPSPDLALAVALALAVTGCLGTQQATPYTPLNAVPSLCNASVAAPGPDLLPAPAPRGVKFPTGDGVVLSAIWRAGANGTVHSGWTLVLLHEFTGNLSQWDAFGLCAASRGYNVLELDFRGHGGSTTKTDNATISYHTFTSNDLDRFRIDAYTGENLLVARFGVDAGKIVVMGASVGANTALWAAADNPRLAGAGLLSPSLNSTALNADAALDKLVANHTATRFFAAASRDDPASASAPDHIAARLGADKTTTVMFDRAGHGVTMLQGTDLEARLLTWLAGLPTR
ncbi:MAG: alpha/beta fold hydrolase [Thermoplasmatota archaeon]